MRSLAAALCVTVLTVDMFLSVFCLPGVLAAFCEGYEPRLVISAPKLEALSGTCLRIPCSFTSDEFNSDKLVSAAWIKRDHGIFDISNSVKNFLVNMTGDLKEKNCTSVFSGLNTRHSGDYFFRLENEQARATAVCDPLQITVNDSAWSPSIDVSGDLKEAESVSITCSAQTPCPDSPPELTWGLQQDSQRTEKNSDGTFTTKIQKNITLSDKHDGDNITCSVRYPVDGGKRKKTAETNLTLSVSYAPKDTSASISPSGVVSTGSWVELSCSSRAKPPVRTFTWFRNTSEGFIKVHEGQVYSFNVSEGGEFYCVALNDLGNQTSPVVLLSVGSLNPHLVWVSVLVGIILLICLVVSIWCFKSKRRTPPETQSQRAEEVSAWKPDSEAEGELHYGDMIFKNRPEASSTPEQNGGQQETVYAQVNLSTPGNCSTQTAGGPEELYAQIKKY